MPQQDVIKQTSIFRELWPPNEDSKFDLEVCQRLRKGHLYPKKIDLHVQKSLILGMMPLSKGHVKI